MGILDRFLTISTADPDDARKRKILNILLTGTAVISVLGIIAFMLSIPSKGEISHDTYLILWSSATTLVGIGFIYLISYRISGRVAAFIFLAFLNLIFVFADEPYQVSNGRTLFTFTIPVFMASILIAPNASYIFAIIGSVIVSVVAISIDVIPNIPAILGFFLIAFVSSLAARSLEQALNELRAININLDRLVAERTRELAEALTRQRLEAGRNQAILNSIADGVIVFDKNWNATLANPGIQVMLEIPLELIINKNFRELIEHPRLSPRSRVLLASMIEQGTQPIGFRIEWSEKTLSVSAAQIYDTRREDLGTVIVFRDFTREAEVERLKSSFVGIVSHELRTPLNAILGYAEMFREAVYGPMNEKQVNMADRIMKNTQRLLGLINDLLDQAQMEAGKLTIHNEKVKVSDLLESLHGLMDKTASDRDVNLTSEIDPDLPRTLVGDSARLQQILVNLVGNAIKFTHQGTIHVNLFRLYDKWGIEVSDTGQGIPDYEIPHIFDTFRQVNGDANREHGGFGLGLSIVKQLVDLMNGDITVQSRLGEGSVFVVRLPLLSSE